MAGLEVRPRLLFRYYGPLKKGSFAHQCFETTFEDCFFLSRFMEKLGVRSGGQRSQNRDILLCEND